MKMEALLSSILLFVFAVFLFVEMQEVIPTLALTENVASVVMVLPTIFLVFIGFAMIYMGLK